MIKSHKRMVALAILAFALMASACFQIRVFSMVGSKALAEGESTSYKVDFYRLSDDSDATGYVFVLIGTQDLDILSPSNFDLKANFGGPWSAALDNSLETYLLSSDNCSASGVSATDIDAASFDEWRAYRSEVEIDSTTGGFSERLRVDYIAREAGLDDSDEGELVVFGGTWVDDDDLVEDGAEITCTSFVGTAVPFKP